MTHLALQQLETREVPAAKLQLIHNSPFTVASVVDVYVNGNLLLDNWQFRTATAFLDLASQTNLKVDITASTAKDNSNPLGSTTLNLTDGSATVAALVGLPGASGAASLHLATANSQLGATNAGKVDLLTLNGSPDLLKADVRLRGVGILGNDLTFGTFSPGYTPVVPADFTGVITPGGGLALATANLTLSKDKGEAAVLMTSGFAHPASVGDDKLALVAVFADGTSVTFSPKIEPAFAISAATSKGSEVMLAGTDGSAAISIIAFPGSTGSARVAVADLTADGVPDLIVGSGPGILATVRILNGATGDMLREFEPFGAFLGGVNVCAGDLTGDGVADYVISPDDGGGPRVRAFDGATGEQIADYFGIDDVNFRGGARAAVGDLDGDGRGDLLVSAGLGGGPRIAVFDGAQLGMNGGPKFRGDFFAFEPDLRNGAYIAAGDINGDGKADLLVGGGPGGGPRVRVFDGAALTTNRQSVLADFFAGNVDERLGSRIVARDVDGDGRADIIAGGVPGTVAVRIFLAADLPLSGFGSPAAIIHTLDGEPALDEVFVG